MILKLIRNALGMLIVFADWVTRPKPIERSAEAQTKVQEKLADHSLYQFFACPFCVKTRRAIHRLGVKVELRDINKFSQYRVELEREGGRVKVPCLKIGDGAEVRWMYESDDIIAYLEQRVAAA